MLKKKGSFLKVYTIFFSNEKKNIKNKWLIMHTGALLSIESECIHIYKCRVEIFAWGPGIGANNLFVLVFQNTLNSFLCFSYTLLSCFLLILFIYLFFPFLFIFFNFIFWFYIHTYTFFIFLYSLPSKAVCVCRLQPRRVLMCSTRLGGPCPLLKTGSFISNTEILLYIYPVGVSCMLSNLNPSPFFF